MWKRFWLCTDIMVYQSVLIYQKSIMSCSSSTGILVLMMCRLWPDTDVSFAFVMTWRNWTFLTLSDEKKIFLKTHRERQRCWKYIFLASHKSGWESEGYKHVLLRALSSLLTSAALHECVSAWVLLAGCPVLLNPACSLLRRPDLECDRPCEGTHHGGTEKEKVSNSP